MLLIVPRKNAPSGYEKCKETSSAKSNIGTANEARERFACVPYRLFFYVKYNLDVGNVGLKENITELWGEG